MFVLLYNFLLMGNAFVFYQKKQDIFLSFVDFDFILLIHSYVYIHSALLLKILFTRLL